MGKATERQRNLIIQEARTTWTSATRSWADTVRDAQSANSEQRSPVEKVARWKWQVRGNWNPREDRIPSAVWLGILWSGMSCVGLPSGSGCVVGNPEVTQE